MSILPFNPELLFTLYVRSAVSLQDVKGRVNLSYCIGPYLSQLLPFQFI